MGELITKKEEGGKIKTTEANRFEIKKKV